MFDLIWQYLESKHPKSLIDILSDGTIIKNVENADIMDTILTFIITLDEELQFKILNAKDEADQTNFLHTIKCDGVIRKVLTMLNNDIIEQLMNEKDVNEDNVYDRAIRLGMNDIKYKQDAQRWSILYEYIAQQI